MFAHGDFERPDPPAYDHLAEITAPAVVVVGDLEYPMVRAARAASRTASPAAAGSARPAPTT